MILESAFDHREVGAAIKDVDIMIGEVTVNLNDELFVKKTVDTRLAASLDSSTTRKSQKKENSLQSFTKYALGFPEKVCDLGRMARFVISFLSCFSFPFLVLDLVSLFRGYMLIPFLDCYFLLQLLMILSFDS